MDRPRAEGEVGLSLFSLSRAQAIAMVYVQDSVWGLGSGARVGRLLCV